MVDFRITWTFLMQSQPPKSPLSGDFEGFERVRVIDKCQLISIIHHKQPCLHPAKHLTIKSGRDILIKTVCYRRKLTLSITIF